MKLSIMKFLMVVKKTAKKFFLKSRLIFFDPKPNKDVAMQVLFIDIDDRQNKSVYEEVIAFYNGCENLTTHHCKTCQSNLCKFCIIDHYKNTAFTKNHEK